MHYPHIGKKGERGREGERERERERGKRRCRRRKETGERGSYKATNPIVELHPHNVF
jgi:hypothetical protein